MTREAWLTEAVELVRPWFDAEAIAKPLPETVRVSVGYGKRQSKYAIGVCYNADSAEDSVHQIFISPELTDPVKILATLLHELIHASDNGVSGHTGEFKRVAKSLGLEGKMTATVPGPTLTWHLGEYAVKLGDYPHGRLNPATKIGKQTTRLKKVVCDCGYSARITRKWIDMGLPMCPCGGAMYEAV